MIKKLLTLFSLLIASYYCGSVAKAQTLQRSVVATAAETLVSPDKSFSLTYVLGEAFGDLLPNPAASLFFTVGFVQPDDDLQVFLNQDVSKSIVLYPNPTAGNTVKLAFNNMPDGNYIIDIIDPIGRILQTQTVRYQNNNFFYLPLDVSQFKGGTYFVRVNNGIGFNGSTKLIKL